MSTLKASNIQNAGSATTNIALDTNGNATVAGTLAMGSSFLRNRIINGDMRIDQRNAGASVTVPNGVVTYGVDRWGGYCNLASKFSVQQNAGAVTPPVGFSNYLGATSLAATTAASGDYFLLQQNIEGFNSADLMFGTVNAKQITVSFWVRSSLSGTFAGRFLNDANNRSYVFTYTISSANTWEYKTVTVTGDTTGTWVGSTNAAGLKVSFDLGSGSASQTTAGSWQTGAFSTVVGAQSIIATNAATFYITGVQLEPGSIATPFERRSYGHELMLCQRYLPAFNSNGTTVTPIGIESDISTTQATCVLPLKVTARVIPSGVIASSGSAITLHHSGANIATTGISFAAGGIDAAYIILTVASGLTAGQSGYIYLNSATAQLLFTGCEL